MSRYLPFLPLIFGYVLWYRIFAFVVWRLYSGTRLLSRHMISGGQIEPCTKGAWPVSGVLRQLARGRFARKHGIWLGNGCGSRHDASLGAGPVTREGDLLRDSA